jgi:rSAM/selenodomain-associated transferase 1
MNVTLLIIAKEPVPGRVKTRLCPPCRPDEAATLAAAAIADTLAVIAGCEAEARVVVFDGEPGAWIPAGFDVHRQVEGGLDQRLADAFSHATGPALLVGMDTPQITATLINSAARSLLTPGVDAVIGPSTDGGWWCIGLRAPDPRVFLGVEMSTARTGRRQRTRLAQLGLRTRLLPALRDVDHYEDACAVAAAAPNSRFALALSSLDLRSDERFGRPA